MVPLIGIEIKVMISIITGDIINSRASDPKIWIDVLKSELKKQGKEPQHWEIYRGDSFQLEVAPKNALKTAILLKAAIKQFKAIDIRMAIGYGDKTYASKSITESNGTAFVNSGECFENLKKTTLAIKSNSADFDNQINLMIELALLTMDNWTPTASTIFKAAVEFPEKKQSELAKMLKKEQSNISEGLKRAGYEEIHKLIQFYESQF